MILTKRRNAAWAAVGLILLAPFEATAGAVQDTSKAEGVGAQAEPQPKFVWGLLLNVALNFAMSTFSRWLLSKLSIDLSSKPVLQKILFNSKEAVIVPLSSVSPTRTKSAGAPENTVAGEPTTPLKVEDGKENYQAVHVALVGFDRAGNVTGLKPVTAGFRTGERIKIKVLPTFDGILVIENISPTGQRKQIFPAEMSDVVSVKRGLEVFVPMSENYYFEFTEPVGDEQLVITVRDPRAFGDSASKAEANRKDDKYGSSFVQETVPGTYPVISQSLKLRHGF